MKSRRLVLEPAALGLALALAAGVGLGEWFFAQAQDELLAERQEREVLMQALALADQAAAVEHDDPGASAARLGALARTWSARFPDLVAIRMVRSDDAWFLASTDPRDKPALPRPLARDEKALYDLGQDLRANVETNAAEGMLRKKQVAVERLEPARLRIATPYAVDGRMRGFVQVDQRVAAPEPPPAGWRATLAIALPLALFLPALGWLRRAAPGRPWPAFVVAAALLGGALYGEARHGLDQLGARHEAYATELAARYATMRHAFAAEALAPLPAQNRWDADEYQRPRGIIAADGAVEPAAQAAALAVPAGRLARSLAGNAALSLALLGFVALGYAGRVRRSLGEHRIAYGYVTPAILGMLVLVFFPFLYGVTLSFTDTTLFNENLSLRELWVGVKNYVAILGDFQVVRGTDGDWLFNYQNFYWTLFITVAWTVCNVAVGVAVGLALALALNTKGLRFTNVYRVLLILPWAIPNYITALTWRGMFHKQYGVINQVIQMLGGEPVSWFDTAFTSFLTGIATNGWLSFPFMMVITLGGLQSIPPAAYEAARVEGAGAWQQFRHITLPYLKPTLIPAIIISVVWTFNMFNIIYLVSGGEPAGSNEILITQAYKIAFEKYQYGYAAAYSVVIFMILLVYGVFQNKVTHATEAIA